MEQNQLEMEHLALVLFPQEDRKLGKVYVQLGIQQRVINQIIPGGVYEIIKRSRKYKPHLRYEFIKYILFQMYNINNIGYGCYISTSYIFKSGSDVQNDLNVKHASSSIKHLNKKLLTIKNLKDGDFSYNPIDRFTTLKLIYTLDDFYKCINQLDVNNVGKVFKENLFYKFYITPTFVKNLIRNVSRQLQSISKKEEEEVDSLISQLLTSSQGNQFVSEYVGVV